MSASAVMLKDYPAGVKRYDILFDNVKGLTIERGDSPYFAN
jgi:hypothetical protein